MTDPQPIPPEYFRTRFRVESPPDRWPESFVIVSAWATTGATWPEARNRAADRRLRDALEQSGAWHHRITGYDGEGDHAEPSWAVERGLQESVALAREFDQLGVFDVRDGELWIVMCTGDREARVGAFLDRVDDAFGRDGRTPQGRDGPIDHSGE